MTSETQGPLLLDTNILSMFFKSNDTRTEIYLPHLEGKMLAVCFITVGEMFRWTMGVCAVLTVFVKSLKIVVPEIV